MTTDRLTKEEIALYIQKHTTPARPLCSRCNCLAEYHDEPAMETICRECLILCLNEDIKAVREEFLK